jgi:hypothetical protein
MESVNLDSTIQKGYETLFQLIKEEKLTEAKQLAEFFGKFFSEKDVDPKIKAACLKKLEDVRDGETICNLARIAKLSKSEAAPFIAEWIASTHFITEADYQRIKEFI